MHRLAARWPAGAVSRETVEQSFLLGEQAAFAGQLIEGAEFRIMTGVDARARRGPGGRTLRMAAVSRDEAERWLRDEPTSTIGFVGRAAPSAAGARIVAPGQLQATTIDRLHDGQQRLRTMLGR
jgi:hypothetical protein